MWTTRRKRCRRHRSRGVSIRRSNRARRSAPTLSSGIQVHSSSPLPYRQNLPPHHALHPPHAKLESDATNVCAAAAKSAASPARDTPPAEIPAYPATSSSAHDSQHAAAPLRPRAIRRIAPAAVDGKNRARAPLYATVRVAAHKVSDEENQNE